MKVSARFDCDIDALAKELLVDADTIKRKVALDIFARLLATTPVDTGRARAGWSVDTRHGSFVPNAGSHAYAPQTPLVPKNAPVIVIYNNVEYITRLNDGHSQQAPAMFVETAVNEVMGGLRA